MAVAATDIFKRKGCFIMVLSVPPIARDCKRFDVL